jgi:hypothetical protein
MPPHRNDVGIGKINGVGAGFTTTGEEVRAEGLVISAGEVGGEDAAGCGHAGKGGGSGEWRVASGEWRVASGEWRVASGEWRVASGNGATGQRGNGATGQRMAGESKKT